MIKINMLQQWARVVDEAPAVNIRNVGSPRQLKVTRIYDINADRFGNEYRVINSAGFSWQLVIADNGMKLSR